VRINFQENSFCILGFGKSGLASLNFLIAKGVKFLLVQDRKNLKDFSTELQEKTKEIQANYPHVRFEFGEEYLSNCSYLTDFLVVSPGFKPSSEIILNSQKNRKQKIITEVDLGFYELKNNPVLSQVKLIGITGTNGKSTVTAWLSYVFRTRACGNFGFCLLEEISQIKSGIKKEYIFCELSSFQLYYSSLVEPYLSVITNIKEDHLDWHGSFENYRKAKLKILSKEQKYLIKEQASNSLIILSKNKTTKKNVYFRLYFEYSKNRKVSEVFLEFSKDSKKKILKLFNCQEIKLIGDHNLKNSLFVLAVCLVLEKLDLGFLKRFKNFSGLEHRLEKFNTPKFPNKNFFNDSKATNPSSSKIAIKALGNIFKSSSIILFLGGRKKNTSYQELFEEIKTSTRISKIFVFGESAGFFEGELNKIISFQKTKKIYLIDLFDQNSQIKLHKILRNSSEENVLFSPACSSFDSFQNFEERGNFFKKLIKL